MTSQRLSQLNIKLFIWKKVLNNGSFRKFFGLLNFPELELFHLFFFKHYDISIPIIYSNLNKVKLFARCSLVFAFCPLVFGRFFYFLLVSCYFLLVALYFLLVARYFLLDKKFWKICILIIFSSREIHFRFE